MPLASLGPFDGSSRRCRAEPAAIGLKITEASRPSPPANFSTYTNTGRAIRNMIIAACPLVYIVPFDTPSSALET
jgi:hypothetical protein